jgi:CSLREA domain-containing protein
MASRISLAVLGGAFSFWFALPATHAAIFNIADGDVAALVSAITTANGNGEVDTINLATKSTYTLTTVNNTTAGGNGLPVITNDGGHSLTINGNGATITRSSAANTPGFRIFAIAGATVSISGVTISNGLLTGTGSAGRDGFGAGMSIDSGTVALKNCNFLSNTAGGSFARGGAIGNFSGSLTLTNSYLNKNSTTGDFCGGGGLENEQGSVTVSNSTVSQNTTADSGGGIENFATMTVTNSTIATNTSTNNSGLGGGGIYTQTGQGAQLTLINDTISGNSSSQGGGILFFSDSVVMLRNTIVAGNGVDVVGDPSVTSNGHNLIGNIGSSSGWVASDLTGTSGQPRDPQLGPLQSNGGPAPTMALLAGSPAIDAADDSVLGAPSNLTSDERGLSRPIGSHVDIGAYELDHAQTGATLTVNTTLDDADGMCGETRCTLRDALIAANAAGGGDTVLFAPGVSGTITLTLGELSISKAVEIRGPGARVLSVDANLASRVLNISAPDGTLVFISYLTLTRGQTFGATGVTAQGGGVYNTAKTSLLNCAVTNSVASGSLSANNGQNALGGGIFNNGSLEMIGCTVSGNSALGASFPLIARAGQNGSAEGGGIFNSNTVTLDNCTLSGNTAQGGRGSRNIVGGQGGAGQFADGGAISDLRGFTLGNCTISGNLATGGSGGAGNPNGVNGAGSGGGIESSRSTIPPGPGDPPPPPPPQVVNTLIAGNTANTVGPDVSGPFDSQGFNLIGKVDGSATGFNGPEDVTGTGTKGLDTKLANNGGPTDTVALLAGSAAIDAGNNAKAPSTDQRDAARSGVSDIGAFEFNGILPLPTPTPTPTATPTPPPGGTPTPTPTPIATPSPTPTPTPNPNPNPTTLANISTRLRVETGDNVLIGGFIITGTQPKKVIVRGIGTSLPFPDKLVDPILELRDSSGLLIDSNDNWVDSTNKQAIIDSTIPPSNDLESAIVATLEANNSSYTAIVRGVNDGTGIGVVEAYDLDTSTDSKLANISTRGLVQTGDNVLIAGTIVVGQAPQKVIVEALGPSLPVPGALGDPTLELRDGNGALIDMNDNWVDSPNKQAIIDSTIPPSNDFESAIVATLPAGGALYTAIVRGVNGTTGVAVVEVFALN